MPPRALLRRLVRGLIGRVVVGARVRDRMLSAAMVVVLLCRVGLGLGPPRRTVTERLCVDSVLPIFGPLLTKRTLKVLSE